jgi:uncharacterized protein YcnI
LKKYLALGASLLTALVSTSVAMAHAHVAPPVIEKGTDNVFTVAVPTEKEDASTTVVELTPPDGFEIDAVIQTPGWNVEVDKSGSGEEAEITKVTWSGGDVPEGQAANLQFVGSGSTAESYALGVRQTYSDGEVVDWSGQEESDAPAPIVEAKSSLGGGGGTSIVTWIALVLGAVGALLGLVALATGRRELA